MCTSVLINYHIQCIVLIHEAAESVSLAYEADIVNVLSSYYTGWVRI